MTVREVGDQRGELGATAAAAAAAVPDAAAAGLSACPGAAAAGLVYRWFQIYSGMQNVTSDLLAEVERSCGLSAPEFQVLWHLGTARTRSAPMNEISRLLNFSTAGTTKLIDRLCAMGLVERRTCPSDRRVILAQVTDAGQRAADQAAAVLAEALQERFVGRLGETRLTAMVEAFKLLEQESGPC